MITFRQRGNFKKLNSFLERSRESLYVGVLNRYGRAGVKALRDATPIDTGETASSWYYVISHDSWGASITFCNDNVQNDVPIALILQFGHATRNGGWVQGRDYINPAIQPIFDKIVKEAWREVSKI